MKPVFFTVKGDGRGIASISNHLSAITVHYRGENGEPSGSGNDSIESITFKGRTVARTETAVLDEEGKEVLRFTETGQEHVLHREDGLLENGLYTFEEHTLYSDGSDTVTKRSTRRIRFGEDGTFCFAGRAAGGITLSLTDSEGAEITAFEPKEGELETTVMNGLNPEHPKVTLRSQGGQAGEPLDRGQAVIGTIDWYNPKHTPQDLTIRAVAMKGMEVIDPYEGTLEPGGGNEAKDTVVWTIQDAAPLSGGSVSFALALEDGADAAVLEVSVKDSEGETVSAEKQVPVKQENCLTVCHELTGSGKEQHEEEVSRFTIRLWNRNGEELAGTYTYTGSREGTLRSGDTIELCGNEFITIDPVFSGCTYEVSRKEDGTGTEEHQVSGKISEEGAAAWFTREAADETERAVFVKGNAYYLTETTAYSDETQEISGRLSFAIDEHGGISAVGGYDREARTVVEKTDAVTGEWLAGARMQLYRLPEKPGGEETLEAEWTTGEEAKVFDGLEPGASYRLKEAAPPDGYGYALDMIFTVHEDGAVGEIRMEDRPTRLIVSKKDITNGEELPGAHLQILDQKGTVVEEWISGDTPHEITGKLQADQTYTLRETIPADGFVIAHAITFTISHDGSVDYVEMEDDTTKVRIYKNRYVEAATPSDALPATPSDAEDEEPQAIPVAGAVLQILNEDRTPALYQGKEMIFTTGETFTLFEKQLISGNTYWLHEIEPAPGYGYSEDVKFTVSKDGRIDVVVMEDRQTKAVLSKKAITGEEELPGCEMRLVDENGVIVDQWISGDTPHEITGILEADHTYRLMEVNPAPGYAYAKEVSFTVNHDGTVNQVEMRDDVTKVEILKVDGRTGEPLSGAQFEILDREGAVIESWTSAEEPHRIYGKLNAGESYTLHEVSAPAGYQKMADTVFTVNDYADVLTIVAENTKRGGGGGGTDYTIRLKKVDEEGKALAGAVFTVTGENGKPLAVTKENGGTVFKVTVKNPQTLTVTEVKAPDGYGELKKSYRIRIPREGDAELLNGDASFYQEEENSYAFCAVNEKTPEIPEKPKQPGIKGRITAEFDRGLYGLGKDRYRPGETDLSLTRTKTGDLPMELAEITAIISASVFIIMVFLYRRRQNKNKTDKKK